MVIKRRGKKEAWLADLTGSWVPVLFYADDHRNALRELQLAMGRKEKKDTFLRDFEKSVQNDQTRLLGLLADTRKER